MRTFVIDGKELDTIEKLHKFFAKQFDWPYYGHNSDALWDLINDVERPFIIRWINADISKKQLGDQFTVFKTLLEKASALTAQKDDNDRFYLTIEP